MAMVDRHLELARERLGEEAARGAVRGVEVTRSKVRRDRMGHIELARWAHAFVIAPATANCIAKLALGLADDLISTTALACEAPLVIAPAMNTSMWRHPAVETNAETLLSRGATMVMSITMTYPPMIR